MPNRRRPSVPYPEFVDHDPERGYRVVDISEITKPTGPGRGTVEGQTDKVKRIMAVPLTPAGQYVQRHEMGHAKWSPKLKPRSRTWLMRGCLDVCEEMRVNQGLTLLGIPVVIPDMEIHGGTAHTNRDMDNGQVIKVALRVVANLGTNAGAELMETVQWWSERRNPYAIWLEDIVSKLEKKMQRARNRNKPVPTFRSCHRIARWLEKELRKMTKPGDEPDNQAKIVMQLIPMGFGSSVRMRPSLKPFHGINGKVSSGWHGGSGYSNRYEPSMSPFYGHDWGEIPPGTMTIEEPKLTIPVTEATLEKKKCALSAEEGTEFRYIERFVSDQRVFKRRAKKRKGGGTVLIDTSGSMHLSDGDVERIVADSPDATMIATYSGRNNGGTLRVVVNNGRKYDREFSTPGGSNVIDLPALEWLSCQSEPRVWLSDGCVTGIGDNTSKSIVEACATVRRDNGIVRCDEVGEVVAALKREYIGEALSDIEEHGERYWGRDTYEEEEPEEDEDW